MKYFLTPALLTLAVATTLTGCDTLSSLNPAAALTGGGNDQGQMMLDSMKSQPTMNVVMLAPAPAVGQWWEYEMAGGAMTQRTAVVAEQDGMFIVEQAQEMGEVVLVNAWLVDPSVDLTEVPAAGEMMKTNVAKAWIGIEGEAPVERPIMDAMEMPEMTGDAPEVEFTEGTETVSLGGREWSTKWTEAAGARTWMDADSGFMLKSVMNGDTAMELTGYGMDAEPSLAWE